MEATIKVVAYALGVIGMAGVWLIPAHLWALVVRGRTSGQTNGAAYGVVAIVILSVMLGLAAFAGAVALPIVFRCLYESRCTGTRGGPLFFLDFFGISVVIAEMVWQAARILVNRRRNSSA